MDKVVLVQLVFGHQSCCQRSSPAGGQGKLVRTVFGQQETREAWVFQDHQIPSCTVAAPLLLVTAQERALFCIPGGPVNSVSEGMWPQGPLPILPGQAKLPTNTARTQRSQEPVVTPSCSSPFLFWLFSSQSPCLSVAPVDQRNQLQNSCLPP